MQFPDDDNGQMLAAMAESGIDLTCELEVDFFLVFKDKRDAESALEVLTQQDEQGELELHFDEEANQWEVIVSIQMVPEYDALNTKETQLNDFAKEFDGISDGWGVMQHQDGDGDFADDHVHDEHCHH